MPVRGSDGGYEDLGEDLALQVVEGEGGAEGVAGGWGGRGPEVVLVGVESAGCWI